MADNHGLLRELRPHATWDVVKEGGKEGAKLMLPFLAGLGIREWVHDHATALMWTAAVLVAAGIAFWERIVPKRAASSSPFKISAPAPESPVNPAILANAPRVRVDHIKADLAKGRIEQLAMKNDSRSPALIRRVGTLVSRERYQTEYSFNMIPSVLPAIDNDKPIECTLYGMIDPSGHAASLGDVLSGGNPLSMDTVVIDYDDDNENKFSRQFVLTRNGDGTVTWTPDPVVARDNTRSLDPGTLDLADLRNKLSLAIAYPKEHQAAQQFASQLQEAQRENSKLVNARKDVELAGSFSLLAEEADELFNHLKMIRRADPIELEVSAYPLRELSMAHRSVNWNTETHLGLFVFQAFYGPHRTHVMRAREDSGFESFVTGHPITINEPSLAEHVIAGLESHAKALRDQAAKFKELR